MSYDLRIAVKVKGTDKKEPELYAVIAEPEVHSPTYNLGEMFRKCTGWDYQQGVYYNVADVYTLIVRGIYQLKNNEDYWKEFNAPNGWGTTKSALKALESLKDCIDDIEDPNGLYGWNTIPKSLLWVAW